MIETLSVRDVTDLAKKYVVPISVLVEVCYTCNENCIHCCIDQHSQVGLSVKQYETLFDQMVKAGTLFVILTGGEPFSRKDFMDIVRAARQRHISVTIFSNGTLLTEKIICELAALYVQDVHVSIYSVKESTHDAITRVPGSFRKSISAIQAMRKAGITVRIKCPLMNLNADEIEEIKKLALNLGAKVQFTTTVTAKNDGDISTHRLQMSEEQLRVAIKNESVIGSTDPYMHNRNELECIPCDAILNGGAIDPSGNVYPCNQWRISGGNILEREFGLIWKESEVFAALRAIRLKDLSKCRSCDLFDYCTRCPGLALLEDGDVRGCSQAAKKVALARKQVNVIPNQRHIFSTIPTKGGDL
jgi:radical SAM protein with 4Fe4S-binding SPASM domain